MSANSRAGRQSERYIVSSAAPYERIDGSVPGGGVFSFDGLSTLRRCGYDSPRNQVTAHKVILASKPMPHFTPFQMIWFHPSVLLTYSERYHYLHEVVLKTTATFTCARNQHRTVKPSALSNHDTLKESGKPIESIQLT